MVHQKQVGLCTCAAGRQQSCKSLQEDEGKFHQYIKIAPTASLATNIPTAHMLVSDVWMDGSGTGVGTMQY